MKHTNGDSDTGRVATTVVELAAIFPDNATRVELPDGRAWYRDSRRCGCGQDDGLRQDDIWNDHNPVHCNGCGDELDWA